MTYLWEESCATRKRIVAENDEEKEQMTPLVRNLNDHLSQRGNSMPFDDKYYFAISVAGDLRRLPPQERCLAKNEIQNIIFKHQMSANSLSFKWHCLTIQLKSPTIPSIYPHPLITYSRQWFFI